MRAKNTLVLVFFNLLIVSLNIYFTDMPLGKKVILEMMCLAGMISIAGAIDMTLDEIKQLKQRNQLMTELPVQKEKQQTLQGIDAVKQNLKELKQVRTNLERHTLFEAFVCIIGDRGLLFDFNAEGSAVVCKDVKEVALQNATALPEFMAERMAGQVFNTIGEKAKSVPFLQALDQCIERQEFILAKYKENTQSVKILGEQND